MGNLRAFLPRYPVLSALLGLLLMAAPATAAPAAEDGYQLWLRYGELANPAAPDVTATGTSPTLKIARDELLRALPGLGSTTPVLLTTSTGSQDLWAFGQPLKAAGDEGFVIRTIARDGRQTIVIAANSDIGLLYGTFHYLRLLQTGAAPDALDIVEAPKMRLRLLNHWDNPDRSVERGYAGQSIWDWWKLPDHSDPRYTDYARANASIGINGTVLNNVNAKADALSAPWIAKAAKLAHVFRPYGIKVYLSARWSAPIEIGGLKTADPNDPEVARWWAAKADEIYKAIPDFGGFLVKANSEGQPGPQDYKRTHAEGANMLAAALKPHGGIVIWRAFVYQHENPDDRHKQAYSDFKPLDGKFADNVIVQVKNGAIDFQPREPFHPLFGATPKTPLALELQITKEYLGFATHLAFLAPMWEEVMRADTGTGTNVAGTVTAMAGVANIGSDRNWSGSIFDQANWYAFGRLAWNPKLASKDIASEWVKMTLGKDPALVDPVVAMMLRSREAVVDYMTPMGLAHLMATGHHYGPAPWVSDLARPEWNPTYYHRADRQGIGFDRTASGSNAVAQYAPSVAKQFASRKSVPPEYLLWFHHVGWDEKMPSGRTLWEELVARYDRGVAEVDAMNRQWAALESHVDPERFRQVSDFLRIQHQEAIWWRDASIAYFQSVSGRPLPAGVRPPAHTLDHYKAISFPHAPGNG